MRQDRMRICPKCERELTKQQKKYCSHSCSAKGTLNWVGRKHTEETKRKFRKNGYLNKNGYRYQAKNGKEMGEHRWKMQKRVGRKLKRTEVVHHWNENKLDNRIDNLCLFRSFSAHFKIHRFAERHGLEIEKLKFPQLWLSNS